MTRAARVLGFSAALALGCAGTGTAPAPEFEERRTRAESAIAERGLSGDPAVEASRAELDAALARERGETAIEGVELRAGVADRAGDTSLDLRVRIPLEKLFELSSQRAARRAESEAALARLRTVALKRRAARCLPALDHQLHEERTRVFEGYATRQRGLVAWSHELFESGVIDELSATGLELASQVKLNSRAPDPIPTQASAGVEIDELPPIPTGSSSHLGLDRDRVLIRSQVTRHQPALDVHRALADRYRALAQREATRSLPSLRFLELIVEPVARRGQSHAVGAQVGFQIPFGVHADTEQDRFRALARSQESKGRFLIEDRLRLTELALMDIDTFEQEAGTWRRMLELARSSEEIADRWKRERLAEPGRISALLDDIYAARLAVLESRERAGLAGCGLLAATGVPVGEWPRSSAIARSRELTKR